MDHIELLLTEGSRLVTEPPIYRDARLVLEANGANSHLRNSICTMWCGAGPGAAPRCPVQPGVLPSSIRTAMSNIQSTVLDHCDSSTAPPRRKRQQPVSWTPPIAPSELLPLAPRHPNLSLSTTDTSATMAIDWASSDEDEFPDLDVVLARAKASQPSNTEPASTRRPPRSRTIAPRRLTSPELSSEADEREEKAETAPRKASTVRRRKLGPRSGNSSSKVSEKDDSGKPPLRNLDVDKSTRKKQPVVKVQPIRSRSRTPDVPADNETAPDQTDESTEEDGLSDFIVHTDDDSDFAAETRSRPRAARPQRGSHHKRPPVDQDAVPETARPETATTKVHARKTKRIILGRSVSRSSGPYR